MSGDMVVFLITAVALPLLLTEFGDWCPWLAVRLVRWAARHLEDPASCKRYEEEWIANLNEVPGKLAGLVAAFGYLAYMPSMRRSARRRTARPLSPALPATYRLPLDTPDFSGRVRELQTLRKLLQAAAERTTDRRPAYVLGMAGIGKTTLAVSCSYQMKKAFPDGQLFLSARNQAGLSSCLDELLTGLGVPASRIPPGKPKRVSCSGRAFGPRTGAIALGMRGDRVCMVRLSSWQSLASCVMIGVRPTQRSVVDG